MRNWTMAVLPLTLAMTVSACNGVVSTRNDEKDKGKAASADPGPSGTRDFALTGFTAVEATGPDDVTIRKGSGFSIRATGPQADLDELEVVLDGDRLSIGRKREGFSVGGWRREGVKIAITMPALRAVRLTGSGSIDADGIEGDRVEAVLTGSGDLKIGRLTGKSADLTVAGSGDIEIDGGASDAADISVAGSGDVDADKLVVTSLAVSVAGSGTVEAQATGKADVRVMGSGDVRVSGGAACTTRKMGSGSITCN